MMHSRCPWLFASLIGLVLLLGSEPVRAADAPVNKQATVSQQKVTQVDDLKLLPGFRAELIYTVPKDQQGSWVSMANGPKGRIIVSDQHGALYRVTPGDAKTETKVEPLKTPLGKAHGLLYVYDSLYLMGQGPQGTGMYRMQDTTGDEQFDKVSFLGGLNVGGEHHAHAIVLGPDGLLYVVAGNMTLLTKDKKVAELRKNYDSDWLLPNHLPASGHNRGGLPLAGFILRTDKEGKHWEQLCGGFRNAYDIAFNREGELFAYDSDMEYDTGSPWYRPTRLNHAISGAEFGWRRGAAKWPTYYADTFGSVIDIGQGCPTGVTFGYGAKFPKKYQDAIYLNDWTYGRIRVVHLQPSGATYTATAEDFVVGKPLPLTDVIIGTDGAMYFMVGGRKTQSKMFRLTYAGDWQAEPPAPKTKQEIEAASQATARAKQATKARALRHKLEAFHGRQDPKAVAVAWPHLNSPDRAIRWAARIAIEHQDVKTWQDRALAETRPQALIMAVVAMARSGEKSLQGQALESLGKLNLKDLSDQQLADALRAYALVMIRLGKPSEGVASQIAQTLDAVYPADDVAVNHELARLLVSFNAKSVVPKTMELLRKSRLQEDQMFYANVLRLMKEGWTLQDRKDYFEWINRARFSLRGGKSFDAGGYFTYSGGRSFRPYVNIIRDEVLKTLSEAEKKNAELTKIINAKEPPPAKPDYVLQLQGQPNTWAVNDLVPSLSKVKSGRSYKIGRAAFEAVACAKCHKFGKFVGNINLGPELTKVASRYSPKDLLESIIEPSKVVSDQHADRFVITDQGLMVRGMIVDEDDDKVVIKPDPTKPGVISIAKDSIEERGISRISKMPSDLLNSLTEDQILDLVAYVLSGGNAEHASFKKP